MKMVIIMAVPRRRSPRLRFPPRLRVIRFAWWSVGAAGRVGLACLGVALAMMPARAGAQEAVRARDTLFSVETPLQVTLRADWRAVFRNRNPEEEVKHPGELIVQNGAKVDTILVSYHTRGNFRLRPATCSIPPIMIAFDRGGRPGTHFAGQRELKLVTHCRDGERYEQNNLVEYLVYKMYNLLTDRSFGARRLVATWEDTARATTSVKPAFVIEDDRRLAERLGGVLDKAPIGFDESDPHLTTLVGLFLLMIGNTDWSQPAQHNIKMIKTEPVITYLPVPYDFDWAGVINAPYARPDASLPIRTVRDRLYRGPCSEDPVFQAALGELLGKREAMMGIVAGAEGLTDDRRKDMTDYLSGFFRDVTDLAGLKRRFLDRCG